MKSECYFTRDLPPYFKFDTLLSDIDEQLSKLENFSDCFSIDVNNKAIKSDSIPNINHKIIR
jgi:hypothetical protein